MNPVGISNFNNEIPDGFILKQNYPNPFNPQTKIKFDVPANMRGQTSDVKLVIYDLLGREVATLLNEELKRGALMKWIGMAQISQAECISIKSLQGTPSTGSGQVYVQPQKNGFNEVRLSCSFVLNTKDSKNQGF